MTYNKHEWKAFFFKKKLWHKYSRYVKAENKLLYSIYMAMLAETKPTLAQNIVLVHPLPVPQCSVYILLSFYCD